MGRQLLGAVLLFAAGAVAAGVFFLLRSPAPSPAPAPAPAQQAAAPPVPEGDPLAIPRDQMPAVLAKLRELDRKAAEEHGSAPEGPPPPPPERVEYRLARKFSDQPLSEVPYQLLGAWDDQDDAAPPGGHRAFVLVVDPDLTDQQLESLARDVRRLHADADRLDVRIYDREDAATNSRVSDEGRYAGSHLVASVLRHRGLDVDVIRVRGHVIEP